MAKLIRATTFNGEYYLTFEEKFNPHIQSYAEKNKDKIIEVPCKKLNCGIEVITKEDLENLSNKHLIDDIINLDENSTPVLVKGIDILGYCNTKEGGPYKELRFNIGLNALMSHGKDGKEDRYPPVDAWMLKKDAKEKFRNLSIPEIIKMIEKEDETIDTVHMCNAGKYQNFFLENKLYSLGHLRGQIFFYNGELIQQIEPDDSEKGDLLIMPDRFFKEEKSCNK